MKDYPFVKCKNPRFVKNPYTGERLLTNCGICASCLTKRSLHLSTLCSFEEQDYNYCLFVTLTYDDSYIPRMTFHYDNETKQTIFIGASERMPEYGKIITVSNLSLEKLSMFVKKCDLDGYVSYTSKRDIQLFIKRLRKRLIKHTDEKLHYYAVSEYGPQTFRAHYHLLFFYNEARTQEVIEKNIRESWTYGIIDSSLSRGGCTSYVSKYLNSNFTLPDLFSSCPACPFSLHSTRFALGFYKSKKTQIYETPVSSFMSQCRLVGSRVVQFMPWRTLTSTYFPKCKNFHRYYKGNFDEAFDRLYRAYTILPIAKEAFDFDKTEKLREVAINILQHIYYWRTCRIRGFSGNFTPTQLTVLSFVYNNLNDDDKHVLYINKLDDISYDKVSHLVDIVYNILLISKHFIEFCCDNNPSLFYLRTKQILNFYRELDTIRLYDFYKRQSDYMETSEFLDDWKLFYFNSFPDGRGLHGSLILNNGYTKHLKKLKDYKAFVSESKNDLRKCTKHKVHNDLNRIFINKPF